MWIHTDQGFVSVVAHRDMPDSLLVRARARRDLETFVLANDDITYDETADYPWRAVMTRTAFGEVMAHMIAGIGYDNFKSQAAATLGSERARLLHDVWSTLTGIETIEHPDTSRWHGYPVMDDVL